MQYPDERLLQFIWQYQLFQQALYTTENQAIEIISVGQLNKNAGPDFLEAKIKIDQIILIGSIEIDLESKLWHKHKHDKNPHYKNVILHIVWQYNAMQNVHKNIPVLELQGFVAKVLLNRYEQLMNKKTPILCQELWLQKPPSEFTLYAFFDKLVVERLEAKTEKITTLLNDFDQHWEQVFFIVLMKNFGYSINENCFEEIAKKTDIRIFAKNKHSEDAIYAVLLGQANLLNEPNADETTIVWKKEYDYLKQKYQLVNATSQIQFGRMLPANFPTIRLAQMAALIHQSVHLFSQIIATQKSKDIFTLFDCTIHHYFDNHYVLNKPSTKISTKKIGQQLIENILINTIIPMLFMYGRMMKNNSLCDKAMTWLEEIHAEENSITKTFNAFNLKIKKANESQALIQLYKNYCSQQRCLQCNIGYTLLKN